jgi:hypothetical protein
MPTGYTAIIEERADLTFREFALRCARGMGACIMQRDDPMDDLPKAPEASDHHIKTLTGAQARLVELRGLSTEGVRALWQADMESNEKRNAEQVAKCAEVKRRYDAMRAHVEAWKPPTKDHDGFRRFMLEQIDACHSDWAPYLYKSAPTPGDWLAAQLKSAEWDVEYRTKEHAGELERAASRKSWIDALYASL